MLLTVLRLAMSKIYKPPSQVRGMKILDRQAFSNEFMAPCVRVPKIDGPRHQKLIKCLKPFLLEFHDIKTITNEEGPEGNQQTILVDESLISERSTDLKTLLANFEDYCQIDQHNLRVNYENWSPRSIFKAVLPMDDHNEEDLTSSSYSKMGHVVQVNLRPEQNEYKKIIGEVLLDKIAGCRTVVNKLENVENQFRTLSFELLAGQADYVVEMIENNCKFRFDFSKVFWNTRLNTEHERLVKLFKTQHVIYDVCAGVGPFAIPSAKRRIAVVANDLNPDCVHWLEENAKLNKVKLQGVHCLDGNRFITEVAGPDLIRRIVETKSDIDDAPITTGANFVMNLPAMAVEFLPSFIGLLRNLRKEETESEADADAEGTSRKKIKLDLTDLPPVFVHCYTFVKGDPSYKEADYKNAAIEKAKDMLKGWEIHDVNVHDVRNVAPNKEMLRISFRADEKMLLADVS